MRGAAGEGVLTCSLAWDRTYRVWVASCGVFESATCPKVKPKVCPFCKQDFVTPSLGARLAAWVFNR